MATPKSGQDGVKKFLESLPDGVKERVENLRTLQGRCDVVKAQFLKEKNELEAKYRKIYEPLFQERATLVIGGENLEEINGSVENEEPGAVPGFWLRVLKSSEMVGAHVTKRDEPILKYLLDIQNLALEDDVPGFQLVFKFAPNPYFKPFTLEKKYFLSGDEEGVLEKTEGSEIEWAPDKNPAFKFVKRKPRGPDSEPQMKLVQTHSFFDFFTPPEIPEGDNPEEVSDIAEILAEDDFEMGCYIKEMLVPNAVSWFTGELADERDLDESEEESTDSDEYMTSSDDE